MDTDRLLVLMPFAVATGVALVGRPPWAPERCTAGAVLHGGALLTLADSVGAVGDVVDACGPRG